MLTIKHSERKIRSLDDILAGPDKFGLLDVKPRRSSGATSLEISRFEEINTFIDKEGKQPESGGDLAEKLMARRLQGYIKSTELHEMLSDYDRHGLLPEPIKQNTEPASQNKKSAEVKAENVTSLDDIFNSDVFAQIDQGEQSIFEMTHVSVVADRETPDEIAQRKVCENFYEFESIFKETHDKLKAGELTLVRFQKASQMRAGDIFILEGVMCLIDEVGEYRVDGEGRYDPRLRIIFENGTESNHLLRSIAKRLYQDETGRRIISDADSVTDSFSNISHKDKRAGQIYFVTTKSDNPALKAIPNLIKIGYTEMTVEERTKNAIRDTAFLEAPVQILAAMECYNLNPSRFESLIHGFLHAQRLNITLTGKNGQTYHPKEWFSVSLDTAREVVRRIIDGTIIQYRMDNTTGRLVLKGG